MSAMYRYNSLTVGNELLILKNSSLQNTYSTALLIGEKVAVIIAQDLGINLS